METIHLLIIIIKITMKIPPFVKGNALDDDIEIKEPKPKKFY